MKNTPNLHFLLALGNQKVMVLKKRNHFSVYTSATTRANVSVKRLSELISSK